MEEILYSDNVRTDINRFIFLEIPLDSFRIFGFLDDNGFRTTAPGRTMRILMEFHDNVQRYFNIEYFVGHCTKLQALTLLNGVCGSIYFASLRVSDT